MYFVTRLPISIDCRSDSYDSIFVIVNQLRKMVYYEPVTVTINSLGLVEVILDVVIWDYSLPNLIVSNRGSFFISKFWSLLCYFLKIKRRLLTVFPPQIDRQTK